MFLNYLKNIFTKKRVKKALENVDHADSGAKVKTIGIIVDETYFHNKGEVISALTSHGIREENVDLLVYKSKIRKSDSFDYPVFTARDLSWRATFEKSEVREFTDKDFDLLINYYDQEKPALLIVSNLSRAKFKVGFSSVDKKLNHFMINTDAENYQVFTDELFKYLKILNKI